MTIPRSTLLSALALAALLPLAACGGDGEMDEPSNETEESMEMAPGTAEDTPPSAEMTHRTIVLVAMNDSGVSGEVMAMHSDDTVVMMLELEGLPGVGEYPAHVHSGNCESGGPVAVALDPVIGLADGTGASTTTLEADEISPDEPHFIMVHGGGENPVACGDVEGHGG